MCTGGKRWTTYLLGVWLAACAGERPVEPGPAEPGPAEPGRVSSKPAPVVAISSASVETSANTVEAPAPVASAAAATDDGPAKCATDSECAFDDPCMPSRCVGADATHPSLDQKCAESKPAPGSCLCVASKCTLKPKVPPPPTGTCEARGCQVDHAAGRCVTDTQSRASSSVIVGPSCDCIQPTKGCQFTWHEPIPCKTVRDCWVSDQPRLHPVKRPAHLRGRDFKPCVDGEIPPACGAEGYCTISHLGYGC